MKNELFESTKLTYKILISNFYSIPRTWEENIRGPYTCYEKSFFEKRPETLSVFMKIQNTTFRDIFYDEHIEHGNYSSLYLDSPCVIWEKNSVALHYELYHVLYNCLFNEVKEDVVALLELFNSKEFENHLKYDFQEKEEFIEMSLYREREFLTAFRQNLIDADKTIDILITGKLFFPDGPKWIIYKKGINNIFLQLQNIHNIEVLDFS